jgi:hypothetical protein
MSPSSQNLVIRWEIGLDCVAAGQTLRKSAEMEGFEPSRGLNLNPLSRRAH